MSKYEARIKEIYDDCMATVSDKKKAILKLITGVAVSYELEAETKVQTIVTLIKLWLSEDCDE